MGRELQSRRPALIEAGIDKVKVGLDIVKPDLVNGCL
jgi:hypothetical protein